MSTVIVLLLIVGISIAVVLSIRAQNAKQQQIEKNAKEWADCIAEGHSSDYCDTRFP